jgi:hypothetical protein
MRFSVITKTVLALINLPQSNWWHGSVAATHLEPSDQTFWLSHGIKVEQV